MPSSDARAIVPSPAPARPKKCRRVSKMLVLEARVHGGSLLGDRLVEVEDQLGHRRVGRQLDRVEPRVARRFALADQRDGALAIAPEPGELVAKPVEQDRQLLGPRPPRRRLAKRRREPRFGRALGPAS